MPSRETKSGFALMPDDVRLLQSLFHYRYLQTKQIVRLLGRSTQVVRRRLRKLHDNGYVDRLMRNHLGVDHAHCLTPFGIESIGYDPETVLFSKTLHKNKPLYVEHSIMVNDLRMSIEESVRRSDDFEMYEWIPEYLLKNPNSTRVEERYVLAERKTRNGKAYFFRPDAAFFVYRKGHSKNQSMFCLEADRQTESTASRLRDKFIGYDLCWPHALQLKFPSVQKMRVLFVVQAPTHKRIHYILERTAHMRFMDKVLFTRQIDINPESFFDQPIWIDCEGKFTAIRRN